MRKHLSPITPTPIDAPADDLKILFQQRDALREENNQLIKELDYACRWIDDLSWGTNSLRVLEQIEKAVLDEA